MAFLFVFFVFLRYNDVKFKIFYRRIYAMPRNERNWNPRFLQYMEMIVNHPNYTGLPIDQKKMAHSDGLHPPKVQRVRHVLNGQI